MTVLVVGAGIVGLAVARELLLHRPGRPVVLLEKEPDIALHQTGHNSGVIHSGIYYPAGSEKAKRVREGIRLLAEFCGRHNIQRKRVGKVIVATKQEELAGLEKLYEQGKANQIPGLRKISGEELREIEPAISGIKALHLPEVELVDFRAVSEALKKEFLAAGGKIFLHRKVTAIAEKDGKVQVQTEKEEYTGSFLVNCGGLYSDLLARQAGVPVPVKIIPFRGEYFFLSPTWARKIRGLVYPVPDPEFPFLGIHLTPTLKGEVTAGPNAVLALAREGYGWGKIRLREIVDYLTYSGFWRMSLRYWRTGLREVASSLFKPLYARSVRKFLRGLETRDLLPGPTGVRAQAVDPGGRMLHDFLYIKRPCALHILNAPSPAATASLAIAKRIAELIRLSEFK